MNTILGSELSVTSTPGEGSLFYFDLAISGSAKAEPVLPERFENHHKRAMKTSEVVSGILPPHKELRALMDLALSGNIFVLQDRLDKLQTKEQAYGPFVIQLSQLLENFELEALRELLEVSLEKLLN